MKNEKAMSATAVIPASNLDTTMTRLGSRFDAISRLNHQGEAADDDKNGTKQAATAASATPVDHQACHRGHRGGMSSSVAYSSRSAWDRVGTCSIRTFQ